MAIQGPYPFGGKVAKILGLGKYVKKIVIEIEADSAVTVYAVSLMEKGHDESLCKALEELAAEPDAVVIKEVQDVSVDDFGHVHARPK